MKQALSLILFLSILFAISAGASAEQQAEVDCAGSCPEGQVMVSFADGNTATCVCHEAAAMDPTVPEPEPEGEEAGDAGNEEPEE